jgi:hypothetical protein
LVKKFHVLVVLAGALLFGFLICHIGPSSLWREFTVLGWGLALLTVMDGAADLFDTQAWRHCLLGSHRSLPFRLVFCVRMSGSAISYLTPTAGFGGEVTKGTLLSANRMGIQAATALIVDKLSLALAQLFFVVGGAFVVLPHIAVPAGLWFVLLGGTGLLAVGIGVFLILQWQGRLGSVVRWAVTHHVGGRALKKTAGYVTDVDDTLLYFYRTRPLDLPSAILWHLMGMIWGILPAYIFLVLLTGHASFLTAGAVAVLGTWFNLVTFALPVDLGVQEASRLVVFRLLGYSSALGLTYGITLRIEQLLWSGLGLFIYALLITGLRGEARSGCDDAVPMGGKEPRDERHREAM